jgi:hypothetical protein
MYPFEYALFIEIIPRLRSIMFARCLKLDLIYTFDKYGIWSRNVEKTNNK